MATLSHHFMHFIEKLKKNIIFKYVSSVKMAVPLMVGILIVVAVGTVLESKYNAQVASILVYRSWWFGVLMGLLWFNIFFATVARIPFKLHHTGFVIIHIGLLTLLVGGLVTAKYGIDGSLRIMEGQSNNRVGLPELALKVASSASNTIQTYDFSRSLEPLDRNQLGFSRLRATTGIIVERYLPFVTREQGYAPAPAGEKGDGVLVDFTLDSSMFGKANEFLHSKDRPQSQMGPAQFHLYVDQEDVPAKVQPRKKPAKSAQVKVSPVRTLASSGSESDSLIIKDKQGNEVGRISLSSLKAAQKGKKAKTVAGLNISLLQVLEQAIVDQNKLVDKGEKGANPALEVKLEKGGKTYREIIFAKYPGFSLSGAGTELGLSFEYKIAGVAVATTEAMHGGAMGAAGASPSSAMDANKTVDVSAAASGALPAGHPPIEGGGMAGGMPGAGEAGPSNSIDFHYFSKDPTTVRIDLHKAGKKVFSKVAKIGETVETPWMGMKLTVNSVIPNAVVKDEVKPAQMRERGMMPESAILVRHESAKMEDAVWIAEGDYKTIRGPQGSYEVYFGNESVELPFSIQLDLFEKKDYPGTETPMSFQSTVRVNGAGSPILISMNEPLKYSGFTLYQSSYEMGQGVATASVLSVNRDPGRAIKYIGSLVLCLGIILFSFMRSKWFLDWQKGRVHQ